MTVKPLIFLSKEIISQSDLTTEGILAYVAIRYICQEDVPLCINSDFLCSLLLDNNNYTENRKLKEKMNRGIQELVDKDFIVPLYTLNKNSFVANCNRMYLNTKEEKFIRLFITDIRSIMQMNNIQHDKILSYFICLVSSVNSRTHIGFTGFDTLAEQANIARQTTYRFNKLLEENNIVYFNTQVTPIKYCINKEIKDIKNFSF